MKFDFDFVSIGGGSAGFNGARTAAGLGLKTAIVDGARKLGGLCILRGCMPSKTLIYSAEILHLAQDAASFGLRVPTAEVDMPALHARKRRIISDFARHRVKQLKSGPFDLIREYGSLEDRNTIRLSGGKRITAAHILIGTGSKVSVPAIPGLAASGFWTSDDVLDLESKPRSVIILGGGIVACELAQYLIRLGSEVCLIQRSGSLLSEQSRNSAEVVRKAFEAEGVEVHTGTRLQQVKRARNGFAVTFERKGKLVTRRADHLLNALGREPDVSRIGLDKAGVTVGGDGQIAVNRWQQTRTPNIYAAGDCCGPHEIVHVAIQQADLAARHSAGVKGLQPVSKTPLLSVVFTDPQVARIGLTEGELRRPGVDPVSASYPFDDHGKSILMNAKRGYVKVVADRSSGRILAAEIVSKDAGELIHCFTGPVTMRASVSDLLRAPWYHPTLAEIITYPLEALAQRIKAR